MPAYRGFLWRKNLKFGTENPCNKLKNKED